MRELRVEGTEVRLHGEDADAERPLLVWFGDRLSPWRSPDSERLPGDLASLSGWSVASVGDVADGAEIFPQPLTCGYRCLLHFQSARWGRGPVSVGGDGFGAGLAAATSILARRYGDEPVAARVLLAPLLDGRLASPSWRLARAEERQRMDAALAAYAPGLDRADPLLSPLLDDDLEGLPPTVIVTAWQDPMRDDGERYAERLRAAGATVVGHRYPGTDHAQACGGAVGERGTAVVEGLTSAMRLLLSGSTHAREPSSSSQVDATRSGRA